MVYSMFPHLRVECDCVNTLRRVAPNLLVLSRICFRDCVNSLAPLDRLDISAYFCSSENLKT